MTTAEIIEYVSGLGGVLTLSPVEGSEWPEISWGDTFFYYAPDGVVPTTGQPFATIVTKDYPDDRTSRLDRPDTFRVNIAAGRDAFTEWTGRGPAAVDASVIDTVIAHPVYGAAGWLAVVNPGERTDATVRALLRTAYDRARTRLERRNR
ncbi:DUF6194 family protein [Nocardia mangyaensis]|uniref:DUF6194 family protein n=1 Tax=Nocardia mangyaensis TaxID=2213200 RepID=UPI002674BCDE|nr:DUF6194 family protein [Nocardia mangyaensis]MDO3650417.1 DUF6194 family protein [Nocardia mangyaensis]